MYPIEWFLPKKQCWNPPKKINKFHEILKLDIFVEISHRPPHSVHIHINFYVNHRIWYPPDSPIQCNNASSNSFSHLFETHRNFYIFHSILCVCLKQSINLFSLPRLHSSYFNRTRCFTSKSPSINIKPVITYQNTSLHYHTVTEL